MSVKQQAQQAFDSFELAFRTEDDSSEYVRVREGSPQWVVDMVREAHGDMFPDDFKYRCVWGAVECIAEADDPEDAAHEWAEAFIDVYTSNLLTWAASHLARVGYCDSAMEERDNIWPDGGFAEVLAMGQYDEAREVYDACLRFMEQRDES